MVTSESLGRLVWEIQVLELAGILTSVVRIKHYFLFKNSHLNEDELKKKRIDILNIYALKEKKILLSRLGKENTGLKSHGLFKMPVIYIGN